jgi:DNA-binding XRE family transcriptional regulator
MKAKRIHMKRKQTPEQAKRERELRERFQRDKPTADELAANGDYSAPVPHGLVLDMMQNLAKLREARERSGLSLGEVARRSGIDKGALSRLERGQDVNPTYETLSRYAAAFGKKIKIVMQPV